jgi:hypothetical protein
MMDNFLVANKSDPRLLILRQVEIGQETKTLYGGNQSLLCCLDGTFGKEVHGASQYKWWR